MYGVETNHLPPPYHLLAAAFCLCGGGCLKDGSACSDGSHVISNMSNHRRHHLFFMVFAFVMSTDGPWPEVFDGMSRAVELGHKGPDSCLAVTLSESIARGRVLNMKQVSFWISRVA